MSAKKPTMLIVGASSGIGEALAYVAAKKGYRLAITGRRLDNLNDIAKKIAVQSSVDVVVKKMDVLDDTPIIYDTMKSIANDMDGIDIIVINAGVIHERKLGTLDISTDAAIINTNVIGAISVADAATKLFANQSAAKVRKQHGGHIVVTSSVSAFIPLPTSPAYAASKSAVTHYFEGIRGRLAKRMIDLTILHPGFIKTAMTEGLDMVTAKLLIADVNVAAKGILDAIEDKKPTAMIPPQPWNIVGAAYHMTPAFVRRRILQYL